LKNIKALIKPAIKDTWFNTFYMKNKRKKYIDSVRSKFNYENKPSIICSNGIGGIIYDNLGLEFLSPTTYLWMTNKDLIKFVKNIREYVAEDLIDNGNLEEYPTGKLNDITLYFNHDHSFYEAKNKWNVRREKLDFNNLYIMMGDSGLSYEDLRGLSSLPCKKLIVFTARKYPELAYTFQLKKYEKESSVGQFAVRNFDGFRDFEKEFDYVNWLNE